MSKTKVIHHFFKRNEKVFRIKTSIKQKLNNRTMGDKIKCPECLQETSQEELDMFNGCCEQCIDEIGY